MGAVVPTVKVATNARLAATKPHWIDFNAGRLLEGLTMEQLSAEFFQYLLAVAGKQSLTQNERNGYRDMTIFKSGVTL